WIPIRAAAAQLLEPLLGFEVLGQRLAWMDTAQAIGFLNEIEKLNVFIIQVLRWCAHQYRGQEGQTKKPFHNRILTKERRRWQCEPCRRYRRGCLRQVAHHFNPTFAVSAPVR